MDGLGARVDLVQMRRREEGEREVDLDPAPHAAATAGHSHEVLGWVFEQSHVPCSAALRVQP